MKYFIVSLIVIIFLIVFFFISEFARHPYSLIVNPDEKDRKKEVKEGFWVSIISAIAILVFLIVSGNMDKIVSWIK